MPISFRPHHFLCSLGYRGLGYSALFVANYNNIAARLRNNELTLIQVVDSLDDICESCPHHRAHSNKCISEKTIKKLDDAHLEILRLIPGEILTWREAKNRMKKISLKDFHKACEPCEWKKMGICEQALRELKNNKK